jgi:hypothetical protein
MGTVDQALLLCNEYLVTENRLLRNRLTGRVRLTDSERKTLAEIGQKLGKQALKDVVEGWGILSAGQYLIHDRDGKYCPAFQHIIDAAGVERMVLPPRSPDLNAYAERWVRSVKDEALSRLILFGEASLRHGTGVMAYTSCKKRVGREARLRAGQRCMSSLTTSEQEPPAWYGR